MLDFLNVLLGASLILAGRKLFWLLVGVLGFVVGVGLATRYFHGSEITVIIAGLVLGVVFAVLAIFVETTAILLAGFLGGGYVLLTVATQLGIDTGPYTVIAFVVGGIIGLLLIAFLLDWALISISSLAGASMVVGGLRVFQANSNLVFIALVLAGVIIQGSILRREKKGFASSKI